MSKLIIVSNRVPSEGLSAEAGGLAVALSQALLEKGGTWLGWSGAISETPEVHERLDKQVHYRTTDFKQIDYDGYYSGFCNSMLWPLCHYRMDLCQFTPEMYLAYDRVNKQFAEEVLAVLKPNDIIWAHDYHLMLLGTHLRAMGVTQKAGFFMHIPFPGPEIFVALPHYHEILKGLSAYDVVGFQTDGDLQSFLRCLSELTANSFVSRTSENVYDVRAFGRRFKAGKFPISIDTKELMGVAEQSENDPQTVKLRESLEGRQMIIGVDRLDYTKGLIERLSAYQHFLQQWPEYRGNVSYVQITPPSRTDIKDYGKIREQLERMAARINGVNAEIDWTPIRYINRSFTRNELSGFYRAARVGLVTPLRDGMNLVAKEYVASQNPADPGVLLLSRFAGATTELGEGALSINPYNAAETAEQIHRALTMSLEERKERYGAMIEVLEREDIFLWTKRFLTCLGDQRPAVASNQPAKLTTKANVLTRLEKMGLSMPQISALIKNLSLAN